MDYTGEAEYAGKIIMNKTTVNTGVCVDVAYEVHKIVGLPVVIGYITSGGKKVMHALNEDPDTGKYYDMHRALKGEIGSVRMPAGSPEAGMFEVLFRPDDTPFRY